MKKLSLFAFVVAAGFMTGVSSCDVDNDSDGWTTEDGDCDDNNPSIHPGATEVCDGKDDDCDGQIDEDEINPAVVYYIDSDRDGSGGTSSFYYCSGAYPECAAVSDDALCASLQSGDCDDRNAAVNPGATETCNSIDDDCDGSIDEACL